MMVKVYGSIKNIITGEEYVWPDMQDMDTILGQLQSVDPVYGKGWVYGGDIGLEDGDIHIAAGKECQTFIGKSAVRKAIKYLKQHK